MRFLSSNFFDFLNKKTDVRIISSKNYESFYIKEIALHTAVSYIANTISKCKFKVYRNNKIQNDDLNFILNVQPNQNENSSQFWNRVVEKYFYDGEALIIPKGDNLYIADGFSYDEIGMNEHVFKSICVNNVSIQKDYKQNKVLYFKLDNINVTSLINGLWSDYGELFGGAIKNFKKNNSRKWKLKIDSMKSGDAVFNENYKKYIKEDLKEFLEKDNVVYPEFDGIDLQEMKLSNGSTDDSLINLRKEIFDIISVLFKIPNTMLLGNMNNMKEITNIYYTQCIEPLANMISEELTRKFFTRNEYKNGCRIKVDTTCIEHVDVFEISNYIDKLVASGIFSVNEIRSMLDYEIIDEENSDMHFITKNYTLLKDAENDDIINEKGVD